MPYIRIPDYATVRNTQWAVNQSFENNIFIIINHPFRGK